MKLPIAFHSFLSTLICASVHLLVPLPEGHADVLTDIEFVLVDNTPPAGGWPSDTPIANKYLIGKFEITNAQYTEFLNAVARSDPRGLYHTDLAVHGDIVRSGASGSYAYTAPAARANRPVRYLTWFNCIRFCNWMHNGTGPNANTEGGVYNHITTSAAGFRTSDARFFLPTRSEWKKAARHQPHSAAGLEGGSGFWTYPTRSKVPPLAEAPPGGKNSSNYGHVVSDTTDVGSYDLSRSFYGTFDQSGNVSEWLETRLGSFNPSRVLQGGSFATSLSGPGTLVALQPGTNRPYTGFRIARRLIIVNTALDQNQTPAGAQISLREAIRDAFPGDVILFDPALEGGTIQLTGVDPLKIENKTLTIDASASFDGPLTIRPAPDRRTITVVMGSSPCVALEF